MMENDRELIKAASSKFQSTYARIENFKYLEGIQLAVNFEIHYESQLGLRVRNHPILQMTHGEFGGRVGVWRLMDLFDKYGIKATFYTTGRMCELYPESIKEAGKRGHEIGNHMWEHRVPSEPELERDHLRKTTEAIEKLCGKKPVGSRSRHKLSSLKNEGYLYVSRDDDPADDLPYYIYDENRNCMLNIPFYWALDDAMHYRLGFLGHYQHAFPGIGGQRPADPNKVYDIWLSAFRQSYKLKRHMSFCLHDFVSGRALRIAMLDRLMAEMKKMPGVWFATCEELARYCLDKFPPSPE